MLLGKAGNRAHKQTKPGEKFCLCIDYRRLNWITTLNFYPMPRIDETLDRLGRAKYITTIERLNYQIQKTAFVTAVGSSSMK